LVLLDFKAALVSEPASDEDVSSCAKAEIERKVKFKTQKQQPTAMTFPKTLCLACFSLIWPLGFAYRDGLLSIVTHFSKWGESQPRKAVWVLAFKIPIAVSRKVTFTFGLFKLNLVVGKTCQPRLLEVNF
jgi:hypothetical protein